MYMKPGYVITSRGCPNRCWFCAVPKREGYQLRELPVTDGWIVADDNLLAARPATSTRYSPWPGNRIVRVSRADWNRHL